MATTSKSEFDSAKDDLSAQIDALKADISGLAEVVNKLAKSGAGAAAKEANSRARAAKDAGRDVAGRAVEKFEENSEHLADYARRKPFAALAMAAGAGLLLGYLTAPRR